jgi:hypothetical protein
MADKRRYTVTLPDHVADAVEAHAKPLGATPTEYAGDVLRWWFGEGCPPVTPDEVELRKNKLPRSMTQRVRPLPKGLDARSLTPNDSFFITDDRIVQELLSQLGLPNLFAQAAEHDHVRFHVAFDNHPTHWIVTDFYKGSDAPGGNGFSFRAYPKISTSREQMREQLEAELKDMEASGPLNFSQIPLYEEKNSGNQTPTAAPRASVKK